MRTPLCLAVALLALGCGDSTTDPDDDTPRFEFSDFRALPDEGCGDEWIEFWADYDVLPVRDVTFVIQVDGQALEQGLIRGTAFQNGRLFIVRQRARRIREVAGYGPHTVTFTVEEANGETPRSYGPMSLSYTSADCS